MADLEAKSIKILKDLLIFRLLQNQTDIFLDLMRDKKRGLNVFSNQLAYIFDVKRRFGSH